MKFGPLVAFLGGNSDDGFLGEVRTEANRWVQLAAERGNIANLYLEGPKHPVQIQPAEIERLLRAFLTGQIPDAALIYILEVLSLELSFEFAPPDLQDIVRDLVDRESPEIDAPAARAALAQLARLPPFPAGV